MQSYLHISTSVFSHRSSSNSQNGCHKNSHSPKPFWHGVLFYPWYGYSWHVEKIWGIALAWLGQAQTRLNRSPDRFPLRTGWWEPAALRRRLVECANDSTCFSFIPPFAYHFFIPGAFITNSNGIWIGMGSADCIQYSGVDSLQIQVKVLLFA